jgi:hypothetical protein
MDKPHHKLRAGRAGAFSRLSCLAALALAACGDSATTEDTWFTSDAGSAATNTSVDGSVVGTTTNGSTDAAITNTGTGTGTGTTTGSDAGTGTTTGSDAGTGTTTGSDAGTGTSTGTGPTSCTIDATTSTSATGSRSYNGTYAVALWIQDASSKAAKAFEAHSGGKANLSVYPRVISGVSGLDAVTGATVSGTINHHYTWDLKGPNGSRVPDGSYKFGIEVHSTTQNGAVYATFTVGSASVDATATSSSDVKSARIVCQ